MKFKFGDIMSCCHGNKSCTNDKNDVDTKNRLLDAVMIFTLPTLLLFAAFIHLGPSMMLLGMLAFLTVLGIWAACNG